MGGLEGRVGPFNKGPMKILNSSRGDCPPALNMGLPMPTTDLHVATIGTVLCRINFLIRQIISQHASND